LSVEETVSVIVEETDAPLGGAIQAIAGGAKSGPALVVATATDEVADTLPTPSKAETA